jgi:hypothetical protein
MLRRIALLAARLSTDGDWIFARELSAGERHVRDAARGADRL